MLSPIHTFPQFPDCFHILNDSAYKTNTNKYTKFVTFATNIY